MLSLLHTLVFTEKIVAACAVCCTSEVASAPWASKAAGLKQHGEKTGTSPDDLLIWPSAYVHNCLVPLLLPCSLLTQQVTMTLMFEAGTYLNDFWKLYVHYLCCG